jgi:hypothetical protein
MGCFLKIFIFCVVKKVNTSFKNVWRTWGPALPTLLADLMIFCPLGPMNFKNSVNVPLRVLSVHCPDSGNAGPHVRQTFLNDVFTFLTEVGNAGRIVNTGTNPVNSV